LRFVAVHVGAMRMTTDLERIGDCAKNIARRVAALNDNFLTGSASVKSEELSKSTCLPGYR
jgi:phosphate uptake regulator